MNCYDVAIFKRKLNIQLSSEEVERDFCGESVNIFGVIAQEVGAVMEEGPGGFEDTEGDTGRDGTGIGDEGRMEVDRENTSTVERRDFVVR